VADAPWRVFVSHTSELREYPRAGSYVNAVERAIIACGHVPVNMKDFAAADKPPADLCAERVRGCDVYVGLLGTRYGTPVRDQPDVSYTELEFGTATDAALDRLMFLLDTDAEDVGIPPSGLMDLEFGARQAAFRQRVQDSDLIIQAFTDPATLGQLVERSLRDLTEQHRQGLDRGQPARTLRVAVTGEIPQEPLGFQPRVDLLAALDAPGQGPRRVRTLTGMRGVGKTHLAAAYARAKVAERWRLVAWINAGDHSGLLTGLTEVAAVLGLDTTDAQAAARAVRHRLEVDGERRLLIFDDATDPDQLRPFLPAAGAAQVIVTSNVQAIASLGPGVPVGVFSGAEALTFLAARTGQADAAGAQALAEELGYLPLALAQAAAVIAGQHLAYGTYLERLHRLPVEEMLVPETAGQYPRGVAATVLVSLENVRRMEACEPVMNLLAVLSPAGVRRALIHAAAGQGLPSRPGPLPALTPELTDRVLARLSGVSLLTFSMDGSAVTAHRLVMRVIRENLAADGSLADVCLAAAQLLAGEADTKRENWLEDRAVAQDLVEQIMALAESATRCSPGDDLNTRLIQLRADALVVLNRLGDNAARVIAAGEPLLAEYDTVFGPDDPATLTLRNNLAHAYRVSGRTREAIALHEETLAARRRVLGPDHVDTLVSRHNLAVAYWAADRAAEAITLHEETLAARERILGADHVQTLDSQSSLAAAYRAAGRIARAITLNEETLAARERILGPDHPHTLDSRNNLANAYQDAGRIGEAIALHEHSLAARERVLGSDHPDTLNSRGNLARAYRAAGRHQEAGRLDLANG